MNSKLDQFAKGLLIVSTLILIVIGISFGGNSKIWVPEIYNTDPVNKIVIYLVMELGTGLTTLYLIKSMERSAKL